jgi:phosphoglycerate dehydrogenase-like enzyme
VNVSRASLVNGGALLARLRRGDIYAALDVFDREPLPADSPLRSLPNVYLTPHRAGGIMESVVRLLDFLTEDLCAFASGSDRRHALTDALIPSLDA